MARRAASISRAVMRARLVAFRPNSPKDTLLPRCARPALRPLNCLRYLVRLGCSILSSHQVRPWCDFGRRRRYRRRRGGGQRRARRGGDLAFGRLLRELALVEHLALEYPHLDADDAVGGVRFRQTVIDVGAEGVQRNSPLAIPLGAGDFRAVEASGDAHLHAQRAAAHGAHDRALHGAAEHHALLDLLRDAVADQLRIELGLSDLGDVQAHVIHRHAEERRSLLAQLLDVLALLADDDAGTRGLDGDVDLLGGAFDQNTAHRGLGEPALEELAHPEVGIHVHRELSLAGIPARGPVAGDPQPYPQRIDLLTHGLILLAVADADGDVTVALDDACATPLGAGGEPLELRGRVHVDERHFQLVDVGAVIVLGVGDRGLEYLAHQPRALLRHVAQRRDRIADRLAPHHLGDQPALLRGNARVAQLGGHLHRVSAAASGGGGGSLHLAIPRVRLEGARRGELAQLVSHHVLRDQHRNVLAAVVHGDGQTHHLGHHGGAARPGLDRLAVVPRGSHLHLPGQVQINERALLQRTWHVALMVG